MLTYAGLKPAAEHVDFARDVDKTVAEQLKSKAKSRPSSNLADRCRPAGSDARRPLAFTKDRKK